MSILQLNPTIPVYIPEDDEKGQAIFIIDPSTENHLLWVIAMDKTGEIWTLPNPSVRLQWNITMGRHLSEDQ